MLSSDRVRARNALGGSLDKSRTRSSRDTEKTKFENDLADTELELAQKRHRIAQPGVNAFSVLETGPYYVLSSSTECGSSR